MSKLAIITSHPIQYNAPWFKLLASRGVVDVRVFYTWEQAKEKVYDPLFKREIKWDIPLLEGYNYTFLKNVAKDPGSHHFFGIDNPFILQEIDAFRPDAILVSGWSFKSHLKVLRYYKNKVQLYFRGDSTMLNNNKGIKSLLRKYFLKWVYSHVDKALFVGENNKQYYLISGLKEEQLVFAPHAIDNDRFKEMALSADTIGWREQLNIPDDAIVFLYAGKLEPRKNPHLLIQAFKDLNAPEAHLVMVGNGVLEDELRQLSIANNKIHFLDFQNQQAMPSIYQFCDIFVLSSVSETWGLAVNEAMACSKVVLVSNQCGCAVDLVDEGVNGYIFHSGNKDDLKQKLQVLANKTKSELNIMGLKSYQKIQQWSFENICKAIEASLGKNG